MSGHVFHPGHHPLHGITVVLETTGEQTYIGRFDTQDESGVHLLNVATYQTADAGPSKDEFIRKTLKFGVKPERPHLVVPSADVSTVIPLGEIR